MEMMRDIPGYKTALKVVLRSQIQFLAEQLSSETDEETVILSASTVDGALYQLGSQYGKYFLQDKGDIQSQFSQHCLNKTLEAPTVKDVTHMNAVAAERALSDPDHSVAQSSSRGEVKAKPGLIYQPETVSNTDYAKQDQFEDHEQVFTDAKPSKSEPDPDKGQRRKKRKRKANDSSTKNTKLSLDLNDSLESAQNDQADTLAHEVKTNEDSAMENINLDTVQFEHGKIFFTPSSVKTTDGTGDKSKVKVEPESDDDDYIDNTGEVSDDENMESIEDMESHMETSAASTSIGDRTPKLEVAEPEMGKKAKHDVSFDESSDDNNDQAISWSALGDSMSEEPKPSYKKSAEKPICQECGKQFSSLPALKRHCKTHIPGLIRCSVCNDYFTSKEERQEHMEIKHSNVCHICGKTVYRNMKAHMKWHEGTLTHKYTCPMDGCNKTFDRIAFYEDHMNAHTGSKPHECQICSTKFSSRYERNDHFKRCAGLTTIECDICHQSFKHRASLLHHKAKHTGETFRCECGVTFQYKSGLNRHKKITNHM